MGLQEDHLTISHSSCNRFQLLASPARVRYESEFIEVEDKTTLILPDEVPSSPSTSGNIEIGITAVNAMGNESGPTKRPPRRTNRKKETRKYH